MNHKPLAIIISIFLVPLIFLEIFFGWYYYVVLNAKNYEKVLTNETLYDTLINNIEKNFLKNQGDQENQALLSAIKEGLNSESLRQQTIKVLPNIFAFYKGQKSAVGTIDLTGFKNSFYQVLYDSAPICKTGNSSDCKSANITYNSFVQNLNSSSDDQINIPDQIDLNNSLAKTSPFIKFNRFAFMFFWIGLVVLFLFIVGLILWSKKQINTGLKYIGIPALIASIPLLLGSILAKVGNNYIESFFGDFGKGSEFITNTIIPLAKEVLNIQISALLIIAIIVFVISIVLIVTSSLEFWNKYSVNANYQN